MRILVTGGAGFIGSHIAESFVNAGHDVKILDNLEPFYNTALKKHNIKCVRDAIKTNKNFEFIQGSIVDNQLVNNIMKDVDVVYHQAAQAGVRASVKEPTKVTKYNINGSQTILEAARKHDVKRVVNASSSSVYGKPRYLPCDENHPQEPVSPYGASKLTVEHYMRIYTEVYGLPTVSLRYFTVYGPRMRPNMAISNFVSRCMRGDSPIIYGDGSQSRDFTYIADIVEANQCLLNDDSVDGQIINIGSSDNIEIRELAEVIRDEIDPDLEIVHTDAREGEAKHTHADISKATQLTGYEPSRDICEGVHEFIHWYRKEKDWYEPLVVNS